MKKITVACLSLLVFVTACTKTQNSGGGTVINPPPPAPDTSTLRKSEIAYFNFDVSGNPKDSAITRWFYDGSRRLVKRISGIYGDNYYDSSIIVYSGNESVETIFDYQQATLIDQSTTTTYFNVQGQPDSVISGNASRSSLTIYHYDTNGNDTLNQSFNTTGGARILGTQTNQHFNGTALQISLQSDKNGMPMNKSIWANGNIVADTVYFGGVAAVAYAYTYNDLVNPGWSIYSFSNNFQTSSQETEFGPSRVDPLETETYSFDASNRVTTQTMLTAGVVNSKNVFVYY